MIGLSYFVEKEKEGIIFAKITKSRDFNDVHGAYFNYNMYEGKLLNKDNSSLFVDSAIAPLDVAIGYFHYGDQLTIVDFTKLAEVLNEPFIAYENMKKGCYQVNALWIKKVMSLNERQTIDFIFDNVNINTIKNISNLAISHLEAKGCSEGALYFENKSQEITVYPNDIEKINNKNV